MLTLAVVVAVFVAYALTSRRFEHWISGPIVFMTVGIAVSEPYLGWFELEGDSDLVRVLLKSALVLVLFSEASRLGMHRVREATLPARLLLVAMPLVMVFGLVVAAVLFDVLSFWEAAVVAALLAPTDAALGVPVVTNERIPGRVRHALVIEGGLNDGLAVPFALFAAAAAETVSSGETGERLIELLAVQVGIALIAGLVVGWLGAKLVDLSRTRGWAADLWIRLALLGLAVVAFAVAEAFHASGFIAAWVGGLVFGLVSGPEMEAYGRFSEDESSLLIMLSFLVFGAIAVGPLLGDLNWRIATYAILSLAVLRPVAVALSLVRSREKMPTVGFLGWFGPRGLPSLVLALILISEGVELLSGELILNIVIATVALSVYAHGLSAGPLSARYARWSEGVDSRQSTAESSSL